KASPATSSSAVSEPPPDAESGSPASPVLNCPRIRRGKTPDPASARDRLTTRRADWTLALAGFASCRASLRTERTAAYAFPGRPAIAPPTRRALAAALYPSEDGGLRIHCHTCVDGVECVSQRRSPG